jgi:hypothetical protein
LRQDGKPRALAKVRYSTHRPSAHTIDDLREDEILLTKSIEWAHEAEWRMFENPFNADGDEQPVQDCWPFHVEPDVIDAVIVGARASIDTAIRATEILSYDHYQHVKLLKCFVDDAEFRLRIAPMTESRPTL